MLCSPMIGNVVFDFPSYHAGVHSSEANLCNPHIRTVTRIYLTATDCP
jgi:hypothetical protein